jgi:hypothetical protein
MSDHDPAGEGLVRIAGEALALFAFDIGFQIDLDRSERLVGEATRRHAVRARRPAPEWFEYSPPPLRLVLEGAPIAVGGRETSPGAELLIYDFGAALLTYRLPLPESLDELPGMGCDLYQHASLEKDARERVGRVIETIRQAIERPALAPAVEDYAIFAVRRWDERYTPGEILESRRELIARTIEAERAGLAPEQVTVSTEARISYTPSDLAVVGWNAAVLFDADPDDVIAVLGHANVELLELRILDQELDSILDHADHTLAALLRTRIWPGLTQGRMLGRFASVQTDAAVMFEGVNNAIKLLGNQYMARLYRLAAGRLDVPSWQSSVQRKLDATESLYQKMSDAASTRRLETLEWVIILLIAISIVLPFLPWY